MILRDLEQLRSLMEATWTRTGSICSPVPCHVAAPVAASLPEASPLVWLPSALNAPQIQATTVTGTHKDTIYTGTLNIEIGDNGAIDNGSFNTSDGANHPLVGQATGRALHLRITLGDSQVLALEGTAANDLILCRGEASGTFGGPDDTDLGTWRTVSGQSGSGGSSGTSNASSGSGGVKREPVYR